MKKLYTSLRYLSFSKQLFIYFLFLCIIPLLLAIQIIYSQGTKSIEHASTDFIKLYASQLNTTINNYVLQIDHTSRTIFSDYEMISFLKNESSYSTGDSIKHNLMISRQLIRFSDQLPFVEGVMIVSNEGNIYSTGNTKIETVYNNLSNQTWFQDIIKAGGQLVLTPYYEKKTLKEREFDVFTAGRLIKTQQGEPAGIILFELSSRSLIAIDKDLFQLSKTYDAQIAVHNKTGELLFNMIPQYSVDTPKTKQANASPSSHPAEQAVLSISNQSSTTGISVTIDVPEQKLYQRLDKFKQLSFLVTLIILIVISPISVWISYHITKPIRRLISSMKHVDQGLYMPIPNSTRKDEFNVLTQHYNDMILKIKHLIEDVLTSKIKQNEARFLALQNQINPHWLNNTLESIRMEAQMTGTPTVANMIKTLGKLFKLALNESNQPHRICDEIEYVETYLELQNIRFDDRFKLRIEMDETLLNAPIPRLIFQPLIENSIIHGFLKHERNYHVTIKGICQNNKCTISIHDDGEGMSEQQLKSIEDLFKRNRVEDTPTKSLGLKNISERLRLHYGESYSISIESTPNKGTVIAFTYSLNDYNKLEE